MWITYLLKIASVIHMLGCQSSIPLGILSILYGVEKGDNKLQYVVSVGSGLQQQEAVLPFLSRK